MIFTYKEQRITAWFYPAICTILARKGKEIERKKHSDCSQRAQLRDATCKDVLGKRYGQVVPTALQDADNAVSTIAFVS